ncbi:MAG TPA: gliding motility-associated C-terminal domain-containing protein [Flavipsychrobacter sp.]|nr:gliding motility-associated C-terminal domain-containing protein [Flavipsychrobacter sp.]
MKKIFLLSYLLFIVTSFNASAQLVNNLNMSTGYNNVTGTIIPDVQQDSDWTITNLTAPLLPAAAYPYPSYVQEPWDYVSPPPITLAGTKWISYDSNSMSLGPYDDTGGKTFYRFRFEMCSADTVMISGSALCDNELNHFLVDGVDIGFSMAATSAVWLTPSAFSYTTTLSSGIHNIDIEVQNTPTIAPTNPTGLDISGTIKSIHKSIIDRDNYPSYVCNKTVIPDTLSIQETKTGCDSFSFMAGSNDTVITIYNWDFGDGSTGTANPTIHTYSKSGTYTVTLITTDGSGKKDTAVYTVKVPEHSYIKASGDTVVCKGGPAQLLAIGGISYTWSPATWLNDPNIANPIASPDTAITYTVTGIDGNDCPSSDSVRINIMDCTASVDVPEAFSPNGDGSNDILYVRGINIRSVHFIVFDRWGIKVFETDNINRGWDGTYNGKIQPVETYAYILKAITINGLEINKKGNVTLLR